MSRKTFKMSGKYYLRGFTHLPEGQISLKKKLSQISLVTAFYFVVTRTGFGPMLPP